MSLSIEERLSKAVRSHRFLWDKSHKFYKNKDLKDRTWRKIASYLNMPENKVVARWRTLRDRYKRDKKRVSSSSSERTIPGYKFAKVLSFLDEAGTEDTCLSECYDKKKLVNSSSSERGGTKKEINSSTSLSNSPIPPNSPSNSEIYVPEKEIIESTSRNNSPDPEASPDPLLLNDLIEIDYGFDDEKTSTPTNGHATPLTNTHVAPPTMRATSSSTKPNRYTYMKDARKEMNQIFEMAKQCLAPQSGIMAFFHSMGLQAEAANLTPDLSLSLQQAILKVLERHISLQNSRTWYRK